MAFKRHKYKINETVFDSLFEPELIAPVNYAGMVYAPHDIRHYNAAGWAFQPVCRIRPDSRPGARNNYSWEYTEIDQSIMYSPDSHWNYAITVDHVVKKWGECANPLGIRVNSQFDYNEPQPRHGTTSRLGRYRTHGDENLIDPNKQDTDYTIRKTLKDHVIDPNCRVEFWARKCTEYHEVMEVEGFKRVVTASNNKQVEKFLLDYYKDRMGANPPLNKARC